MVIKIFVQIKVVFSYEVVHYVDRVVASVSCLHTLRRLQSSPGQCRIFSRRYLVSPSIRPHHQSLLLSRPPWTPCATDASRSAPRVPCRSTFITSWTSTPLGSCRLEPRSPTSGTTIPACKLATGFHLIL